MENPLELLEGVHPAEIPAGMYDRLVLRIEEDKSRSFSRPFSGLALAALALLLVMNTATLLQNHKTRSITRQLVQGMQLINDNDLYK